MYPFKYVVSFRVRHSSMSPDIIVQNLGLTPEYMWKAGDVRKSPKGTPLGGVHDSSYCTFRLEPPERIGLADFLKNINRELHQKIAFLKTIRRSGGTLEYFVGWFSDNDSGEVFDLELMNQLVELEIDLSSCTIMWGRAGRNKRSG